MANDGVIPDETASEELRAAEMRSCPVPLDAVPIEKYVSVSVPPVAVGNVQAAAFSAIAGWLPVLVQPPELLAMPTRA